ncbi:24649_t:CDS:2 [Racocetra persica]|uniref:24649_t:CDS:1 n=1 Tax=Racocetra persica TaxID=160502 RepID=A0ACA9LGB2_9GLOM|nr:24649_t:CDS:2 [Racocetra persica]
MKTRNSKTVANNKIQTTSKPAQSAKRGRCKKKQDTIATFSQIIDDLLNDANNLQGKYYFYWTFIIRHNFYNSPLNKEDKYEVDSISESSQSSIIIPLRQLSPDLRLRNESPTLRSRILSQVIPLSKSRFAPTQYLSPALESRFASSRHSSPALESRINTQNDFTSFYQNSINPMITSLKKSSALELMNLSMKIPATDSLQLTPSTSLALSSIAQDQYEKKTKASQDYLEKLKSEGIEWLQVAKRHFGDFCNKLINNIEELVKDFKKKRICSTTSLLQKEKIIAFADESATVNILNRVFAINYTTRDVEGTRALDRLTKKYCHSITKWQKFHQQYAIIILYI